MISLKREESALDITILKALIAGFFGIPGAAAVILWDLFVK